MTMFVVPLLASSLESLGESLQLSTIITSFVSVAAFALVPDEVFFNLREGECLIAAYQSSGHAQVYRVRIRPTVTYAGGETLESE